QAEDGIRDDLVTGVQTCALPILPALMRSYDDWRVTSLFSKMICPLSGGRRPLTRLTRVVLPAPLDPISASTSPWFTTKSTAFTEIGRASCGERVLVSVCG